MLKKAKLLLTALVTLATAATATVSSAAWNVTVRVAPQAAATVDGGTLGKNVFADDVASKVITLTPATGYEFKKVVVNGKEAFLTDPLSRFPATFAKSATSQSISATLAVRKFTISTSVDSNTIAAPPSAVVAYGKSRAIRLVPKPGFQIQEVTDNGTAISVYTAANGLTPATLPSAKPVFAIVSNVTANHTIFASTETKSPVHAVVSPADNQARSLAYFTNGGTLAFDASQTTPAAGVTYAWSVAPATGATVTGTAADLGKTASFTATAAGSYVVTLTATYSGATSTANVTVLVNANAAVTPCSDCHSLPVQYAAFAASPHGTSTTGHAPADCESCHGGFQTSMADVNLRPVNKCEGCHAGPYGKTVGTKHSDSTYFQQNRCAMCHNPHSTTATFGIGSATGCQACHAPGKPWGIYSSNLVGKQPHFSPYTSSRAQFGSQAYFMQPNFPQSASCNDCHGHNNDINAGWAEGGHGNVNAAAWKSDAGHTWLSQGPSATGVNFQNSPQQTNCIRCHTPQGFAAFVDSGFQTIDKIKVNGSDVKISTPLTCNGCHTSVDTGALRLQNFTTASHGAKGYKAFWGYSTAAISGKKVVTSIQLGDNRNSNICMPCHSQRASGQEIKDVFATGAFKQYSAGSAIYPHEAQPAAIFYGKGGYEFTATTNPATGGSFAYQDRARHQRIGNYVAGGATGYNNTGITQGSCVACHMSSDKTHSLEITSASFANTCTKCHPSNFTYQDVANAKTNYDGLVKALGNVLVSKGITLDGVNPLPERKAKDMSLGAKNNAIAEANMGAWFNWYLFKTADPGAYAHNPSYARRLLTDSIDKLDDGVLNNSAANTVMAQVAAGKLTADEANAAISFTQEPGCLGCHFGSSTNSVNGEAVPGIQTAPHFNTNGATVPGQSFTQAQFVTAGAQCNNCHGIGHGTDSPNYSASKATYPNISSLQGKGILKNYAESAHGETNGLAWTDYDFKARATCNVCHTTGGFVRAFTGMVGNAYVASQPAFGSGSDTTKQVLACNACHSSTNWKNSVRTISGGYNAGMSDFGASAKATISYPDAGESNVCIPCHSGRENGASMVAGVADYTNASFKNPHYLAAAATFYGKGGFQFYTSGVRYNTYGAAGKVGRTANWSHGKLGFANYTTTSNATVRAAGVLVDSGNKGACVACHMGPTNTHSFSALATANATQKTSTYTRGCYGCHNGTDMNMATFIDEEKEIWNRMFDFFAWNFAYQADGTPRTNQIFFDNNTYPYFFNDAAKTSQTKNWTLQVAGGTGAQTMGAAMNLKLLVSEKGSFVHNRRFGRALAADSIVYLQNGTVGDRSVVYPTQNGVINFSAYSTARPTSYPGQVGPNVSITTLKSYLTSASGGGYVRR